MQHWIIYCYQRAKSWSALLGCTRSRVGTMHFCYAAVVEGRLQRLLPPQGQTSYLRHCRSHFHSRYPVYRRKKGKGGRDGGGKEEGVTREINTEHGWWVWRSESTTIHSSDTRWWRRGWMMTSSLILLTSLPHDHSSPSLSERRISSTSYALEQGNANIVKASFLGVAFLL